MKSMLAVLVASAAVLGLLALPASAKPITSSLTISFDADDHAISGKLGSPKPKCRGNRRVTIKRQIIGIPGFHDWDSDKTNSNGRYETALYVDLGYRFKAVVKPVKRQGNTCKGATSKTIESLP